MTGQKRNQENPMPAIDEGWWSSVLAEESCSAAHEPVHSVGVSRAEENETTKTAVSEKKPATNWI